MLSFARTKETSAETPEDPGTIKQITITHGFDPIPQTQTLTLSKWS